MEMDAGMMALLKENGMDGGNWNNPLYWLIILGFLGRQGGLFGGDGEGAAAGATQAKLDCLAQGQQDAANAAHNANMTNLIHSLEMSNNNGFTRMSAQLAECCCDLRSGQKEIINELCKQTQTTVAAGVANTQRIVDSINKHAETETLSKLSDCKSALSNEMQSKELLAAIAACCSNDGHGRGRGLVDLTGKK